MTSSRVFRKRFSTAVLKWAGVCLLVAAVVAHVSVKFWLGPAYVEKQTKKSLSRSWSGPARVGEIEFGYDGVMFIREVIFYDQAGREVMKAGGVRMVLGNWPSLDAPAKRIEVERLEVSLRIEGGKPVFPARTGQEPNTGQSSLEYMSVKQATITVEKGESQFVVDRVFAEVTNVGGAEEFNIKRDADDGRFHINSVVNPKSREIKTTLTLEQMAGREQTRFLLKMLGAPAAWSCEGRVRADLRMQGNLSDAESLWPQGRVSFEDWTILLNDSVICRQLGGELAVEKRHLGLERVKGVICDGRLKGSFYVDVNQSGPVAYGGNVLAADINMVQLTQAAETEKRFTKGKGLFNVEFAADTSGPNSLRAYGSVFLDEADVWRFPLIGELFKSIGIWEYRLGGMSDAEAEFRLSGSRMTIERGHLSNRFSAIEAEPGGEVDINSGQVDMFVVAAPLKDIDRIMAKVPVVNWFASFKNKLIRLRLKGHWSQPAGKLIHKQPLKDIKEGTIEFMTSAVNGGGHFTEKLIKGFGLIFDVGNDKLHDD